MCAMKITDIPLRYSFLPLMALLTIVLTGVIGCVEIKENCYATESFCATTTGSLILPKAVTQTPTAITCDFGSIITAKPVIRVSGPAKAKIKYRTYSNAADAAESVFELPDLNHHERATDLMDRIVRITATHESKFVRNFRFLDIELSDRIDILKIGAMAIPSSSQASCPRQ